MKVVVTGGTGKAGTSGGARTGRTRSPRPQRRLAPDPNPVCGFRRADLTDSGKCSNASRATTPSCISPRSLDLAVHGASTFQINVMSTFNVFNAVCLLGSSGCVGIERDDARLAFRSQACVPADRRRGAAGPEERIRALESRRRGNGPLLQRPDRRSVHRPSFLQRLHRRRLRAYRVVAVRRACAELERLGYVDARDVAKRAVSASKCRSRAPTSSSSPQPTP